MEASPIRLLPRASSLGIEVAPVRSPRSGFAGPAVGQKTFSAPHGRAARPGALSGPRQCEALSCVRSAHHSSARERARHSINSTTDQAEAIVARSTRTPTPIVDDTASLRRYTPLLVAGWPWSAHPEAPTGCPRACRLERAATDRAVDDAGLVDAELHLAGLGISSRRWRHPGSPCRPSGSASAAAEDLAQCCRPTRMVSGDAITTSKSRLPALTWAARSSMPTTSAPAALASSAFAPWRTPPRAWSCRCRWASRRRHAPPGRTSLHQCPVAPPRRWTHRTWRWRNP